MMTDEIRQALAKDRVIDMTTIGRKSGLPRRIETWYHNLDGQVYLTGLPGARDWYANLLANPSFTFHLKESVTADLAARARPVTDRAEREVVLARILRNLGRPASDLPAWVEGSPLVAVTFDEA